ncbi:MAG: sodium-dependent transporter [Bacillota bacterium]
MQNNQVYFATRLGFIAAALSMAVGTGNIWRFPRVAAANGGGAFTIALIIALIVWAVPLLMSEMVIGRYGRKGTIGSYGDFMGRSFSWLGAWMGFVCLAIMFYYSVVTGWTIKYFVLSLQGAFKPGVDTQALWNAFTTNPSETILYHFVAMAIAFGIIYQGVTKGIEKYTRIMMPALLVLLVVAALRAITLPGAWQGVDYLFRVDPAYLLKAQTWLAAFTQAAWSTGAGWGLLMTYAIYSRPKDDVGANSFIIGFGDISIALIAGLAVLPTIFALAPSPEFAQQALGAGNTGLTFIYMAQLFPTMPGGSIIAACFFLALAFAAITSLLSMIELGVANLVTAGWERKKAAIYTAMAGFILGIPSAYSLNFLDNQDWVWGVGLLISGLFTAWAVMKFGTEKVRKELINHEGSVMYIGSWFNTMIYLIPVVFAAIFGWWVWQSITWYPDNWWSVTEVFSVGTMVVQWAVVLAIFIAANKWLGDYFNPNGKMLKVPAGKSVKGGK